MRTVHHCDECQAELAEDAPEGLCPQCLLRFGGVELGIDLEMQNEGEGVQNSGFKVQSREDGVHGAASEVQNPGSHTPVVSWTGGSRFDNYELLEKIGQGGMGSIYKARQLNLDRIVALKLLPLGAWSGDELVRRFRSEAKAAAALQHPNIVAVHDVGEHEGQPFFSMDFVEGRTLAELVRDQPLSARRAAAYLKTIARAVHYAHQQGIFHRDLKPSNILVDTADQPRITDFGLAKRLHGDSDLTLTGQVLGSPNFISPEQAEGCSETIGPASDVYSLGALLYHLLTRQPPFQADTLTTLLKQVLEAEPVPPRSFNPSIPNDLETICLKCLEKEPGRRYATAQALADDLGRFLSNEPILARPVSAAAKGWKWCRRRPALTGVSVALVLAILAGLSVVLWQLQRTRASELLARRNAYAADMNLAQVALENGDLGAALSLLETHRPKPGERDLRGWEWRYLWQRCRSDELFELTHSTAIYDQVAFSPDGRYLGVRDDQAELALWDINSRQAVCSFKMSGPSSPFGFSQKKNLLGYAAAGEGIVSIVSLDSRKEVARLRCPPKVAYLGFSSDAARLYTVSEDSVLIGWDVASGQALRRVPLPGFDGDSYSTWLVFSPDSSAVAFRLENGLALWEPGSDRQIRVRLAEGEGGATAACFSPDGRWLAVGVGGAESEARVWAVEELWDSGGTAPPRGRYGKHRDWICDVAFSPDGRALVSASADSALRLWELEHPETPRRYQGHQHQVLSVAWSPDGKRIASCGKDGSVRIWDLSREPAAAAALEIPLPVVTYCFRLSPDGKTGIALNTNHMAVLWDTVEARPIETLEFAGTNLANLAWAPDGTTLAVTHGSGPDFGRIDIWDLAKRRVITNFMVAGYWPGYIQFVHNGRLLWCGGARPGPPYDRIAKLWQVKGWREIPLPGAAMTNMDWVAFSPDARVVVARHSDGILDWWDIRSGRCLGRRAQPFAGPPASGQGGQVTFSPDGRICATSTHSGVLCLWDMSRELSPLIIPRSTQELWGMTFTPDGSRLLVGGKRASDVVRLLDPYSRRYVAALPGKAGQYWFVRMTPDQSTVYAVGDERVLIWRAPSWAEIEQAEKGNRSP